MAFLCPSRVGRNVKAKRKKDKPFSLPGRITGSDSIDTLVRVGLEKEHGLSPESRVFFVQEFNPGSEGEIIARKGEEAHILYTKDEWAYIIKRNGSEGFVPLSYCSRNQATSSLSSNMFQIQNDSVQRDSFISNTFDTDSFYNNEWSEFSNPTSETTNFTSNERVLHATDENCNHNTNNSQPSIYIQDVRPFRKTFHGQFIVLFDFGAVDENDVTVERAEVVDVFNIEDPDWSWVKKYNGEEGFVPKSYICPIEPLKVQEKAANAKLSRVSNKSHNSSPFMSSTPAPTPTRQSPQNSDLCPSPFNTIQHSPKDPWEYHHKHRLQQTATAKATPSKEQNSRGLHPTQKTSHNQHTPTEPQFQADLKHNNFLTVPTVTSHQCNDRLQQKDDDVFLSSDLWEHNKTMPSLGNKAETLSFDNIESEINTRSVENEYTLMPHTNQNKAQTTHFLKSTNGSQNLIKDINDQERPHFIRNNNGTNAHSVMVKNARAIFEGAVTQEENIQKLPPKLPPRTFNNKSQERNHQNLSPDIPPKVPPRNRTEADGATFPNNQSCDKDTNVVHISEFVTIYDYIAQSPDDLTVTRGELVYTDTRNMNANEDWVWVYSVKSKTYGYVPRSFIKTPLQTAL